MNNDIFQLKVIYTDAGNKVEGMPYRIIQYHKDTNLLQLASHILKSFSFKMSEPFGFYDNLKNWEKSENKFELFEDNPKKNTLKNTYIDEFFQISDKFLLVYDYLEEHRFLIYLMARVPERNIEYPEILESRGESLPENESTFNFDEEEEPKYGIKKPVAAIRDEFDDIEDDELAALEGREGEMGDDEEFGEEPEDEFGFDEYGGEFDEDIKE
jgi:hypothetical protein